MLTAKSLCSRGEGFCALARRERGGIGTFACWGSLQRQLNAESASQADPPGVVKPWGVCRVLLEY